MPNQDSYSTIQYNWEVSENGWGDAMNNNLKLLSFFYVHPVIDDVVETLPFPVVQGAKYIYNNDVYYGYNSSTWYQISPKEGFSFKNKTTGERLYYNGTEWVSEDKATGIIVRNAGEDIIGHSAVVIIADEVYTADVTDETHLNKIVGIAINSANDGGEVKIQTNGIMTENSWTFSDGAVFVGLNGVLTQSIPSEALFVYQIGSAINETEINISLKTPIRRA